MEEPEVVLERMSAFLDDVGSVPVSCWSRDEIATWLCGLQSVRARVEALCLDPASVAALAGVPTLEPEVRTLRQFTGVRTNGSGVEVACDLKLAQWLTPFPALADALRAGRITRRHAEAVRSIDNPPHRQGVTATRHRARPSRGALLVGRVRSGVPAPGRLRRPRRDLA